MPGLACDVEVHSAVLAARRSVFLNSDRGGGSSISRGLLSSIRTLAGQRLSGRLGLSGSCAAYCSTCPGDPIVSAL